MACSPTDPRQLQRSRRSSSPRWGAAVGPRPARKRRSMPHGFGTPWSKLVRSPLLTLPLAASCPGWEGLRAVEPDVPVVSAAELGAARAFLRANPPDGTNATARRRHMAAIQEAADRRAAAEYKKYARCWTADTASADELGQRVGADGPKTPPQGGSQASMPHRCTAKSADREAHESRISRRVVEEAALTGLVLGGREVEGPQHRDCLVERQRRVARAGRHDRPRCGRAPSL